MSTEKQHPKYEIPNELHAKHRYESAMKHIQFAKDTGKSSQEIHALFQRIMKFDPKNIESIPADEGHKKYRSAVVHALKALENGKTPKEAHTIFNSIMTGNTSGHGYSFCGAEEKIT